MILIRQAIVAQVRAMIVEVRVLTVAALEEVEVIQAFNTYSEGDRVIIDRKLDPYRNKSGVVVVKNRQVFVQVPGIAALTGPYFDASELKLIQSSRTETRSEEKKSSSFEDVATGAILGAALSSVFSSDSGSSSYDSGSSSYSGGDSGGGGYDSGFGGDSGGGGGGGGD